VSWQLRPAAGRRRRIRAGRSVRGSARRLDQLTNRAAERGRDPRCGRGPIARRRSPKARGRPMPHLPAGQHESSAWPPSSPAVPAPSRPAKSAGRLEVVPRRAKRKCSELDPPPAPRAAPARARGAPCCGSPDPEGRLAPPCYAERLAAMPASPSPRRPRRHAGKPQVGGGQPPRQSRPTGHKLFFTTTRKNASAVSERALRARSPARGGGHPRRAATFRAGLPAARPPRSAPLREHRQNVLDRSTERPARPVAW